MAIYTDLYSFVGPIQVTYILIKCLLSVKSWASSIRATATMSFHDIYTNRYEPTSKAGQSFWKLMLVWKGSVLKLIWVDLVKF